jgi:uncharacterized protein (TIGR00725 family)
MSLWTTLGSPNSIQGMTNKMVSIRRVPIVTVLGSGTDEYRPLSEAVGGMLARLGVHLLTGGGRGVMAAVSQAFAAVPERQGLIIGILPCREDAPGTPKEGYPNPWVEVVIPTHLPLSGERGTEPMSRNHINVLAAEVLVALPGGLGTASEVTLAVRYRKPVIAFLEAASQLPGLPSSVPLTASIQDVEEFVRSALRT